MILTRHGLTIRAAQLGISWADGASAAPTLHKIATLRPARQRSNLINALMHHGALRGSAWRTRCTVSHARLGFGQPQEIRLEETMAWTTPTLVEICIGLEINGYLPAEF